MNRLIQLLFFGLIIKPVAHILLGLNVWGRHNLPLKGPAVIAANHNSHLDTLVLMALYPLRSMHRVRPVAAADYFLKNRFIAWFSLQIMGIIPLQRAGTHSLKSLFSQCHEALDNGDILILFPEGSRGRPEALSELKRGLFHLVRKRDEVPVIPVVMHGLGRALPKGEGLFVPHNCDVIVGEPLPVYANSREFVQGLAKMYAALFPYCLTKNTLE